MHNSRPICAALLWRRLTNKQAEASDWMQELVNEALLAEDARAVEQAKCVGMTLLLQVHPFQADLRSSMV